MLQLTVTKYLVVVNAVTDMKMVVNQVAVVQLKVTKCLVVVNAVIDMNTVVNQNAQHLLRAFLPTLCYGMKWKAKKNLLLKEVRLNWSNDLSA